MPFWSDVVKVVGIAGGAVLCATGVASPLGAALIGGAVAGAGEGVIGEIERKNAREEADRQAAEAKRLADEKIARDKAEADRKAKEVQAALDLQLKKAQLPDKVMTASREGRLNDLPDLLREMDDDQIRALGLAPLAECTTAESRQGVLVLLTAERTRRRLTA